jgi:predicted enzyme related to lactoylglutathione lyase
MAAKRRKKAPKKPAKAPKKAPKKAARSAPPRKPAAPSVLPVVHWEIRAREPERQQEFYRSLFDWIVDANNPMKYGMVKSSTAEGGSIDGGIGGTNDDRLVTFYVRVSDIDTYLAKVERLGGKTLMPRSDIGPVIMATFQDPEGNEIGLIEG